MFRVVLKVCLSAAILCVATPAAALERICDSASENCRTPLLDLISAETQGIDVAFWFMEDARYSTALIERWNAGVPVRVLIDTRAFAGHPTDQQIVAQLRDAGIPIRAKRGGGILHWKTMFFAGQRTVEFSGANYSPYAFVPVEPYSNYVDEAIYFTDRASLVESFATTFDDLWTSTTEYSDYANVTNRVRNYATSPIDPSLNFPPNQSFRSRSVAAYKAESQRIDALMYRITDRAHADQMIAAVARGVPVRLLTEPQQYRDSTRLWHAWNVDRMYVAGVQIRHRAHAGLLHEKLTVLTGRAEVIFGSSNWTSPSSDSQREHNLFTTDPTFVAWAHDHFDRKWNNLGPAVESTPFVPLPPDTPELRSPAVGATGLPTDVTLKWYAGPWAHKYDVYIGTSESSMTKVLDDMELGPSEAPSDLISWTVSGLAGNTTYYWKVIGRTMANLSKTSATGTFTTGAATGGGVLPSGWGHADVGDVSTAGSVSYSSGVYTVQGSGTDIWGTADQFHFAFQSLTGDIDVRARVADVSATDVWTKAGVMIRASLDAGAPHASMVVTPGRGLAFQRRVAFNQASSSTAGGAGTAPEWVRVTRVGDVLSGYISSDGISWSLIDSDTIKMGSSVLVGLALTSHDSGALATADFDHVEIQSGGGGAETLPNGWSDSDLGTVATAGSARASSGTFTVEGSGADIWGTADAFNFAYRTLTGNGSVVARVASVDPVDAWTKAGVMIRASLSASSRHAMVVVTPGKGIAFQRRLTDAGVTVNTGVNGSAPRWLRLVRDGDSITASQSADGVSWTVVGSDTMALPSTVYVGLAVTSHNDGPLASADFDHVTVAANGASGLPTGYTAGDIGAVGSTGSAGYASGTFTVMGDGTDIWGTADAFQFVSRQLTGDGSIVARVASVENVDAWTKAGVMIRASLSASSAHASLFVTPGKGLAFQRRETDDASSVHTSGGSGTAPMWVRLDRAGSVVTASVSADGETWTVVGSDTIALPGTAYVGLAVTSHQSGTAATATFDQVE